MGKNNRKTLAQMEVEEEARRYKGPSEIIVHEWTEEFTDNHLKNAFIALLDHLELQCVMQYDDYGNVRGFNFEKKEY